MFEHVKRNHRESHSLTTFNPKHTIRTFHQRKALFVVMLIGCLALPLQGMAQQKNQALFQRFEERFCLLDSLIFRCAPGEQTATASFDTESYATNAVDSLIDIKIQRQHEAVMAETGLLLSGQTYHRSGSGMSIDPDENDAIEAYNAKLQIELRWNILSSGLHNRKGRLEELSLEGELEHVYLEQEHMATMIDRQKRSFREAYDSLLGGVLQLRIDNLQLLNDAQAYLASDRSIGIDDLLKIMDEQAIAERSLSSIPRDYPIASQLATPEGIIIRIDTARLKKCIRENTLLLQEADLNIGLLQQREKNTSYWNTLNISPFLRYSYYAHPEVTNPSTVDVGVAFQIPLSGQESRKRRVLVAERLQKTAEREELETKLMTEVEAMLVEIERANRGLQGELYRIEMLREYMHLRRQHYQGHIGEYNFMSRIKEYNHYLTCWENYYSYQYKRDCIIADLQAFLSRQSIVDFCIIQK